MFSISGSNCFKIWNFSCITLGLSISFLSNVYNNLSFISIRCIFVKATKEKFGFFFAKVLSLTFPPLSFFLLSVFKLTGLSTIWWILSITFCIVSYLISLWRLSLSSSSFWFLTISLSLYCNLISFSFNSFSLYFSKNDALESWLSFWLSARLFRLGWSLRMFSLLLLWIDGLWFY